MTKNLWMLLKNFLDYIDTSEENFLGNKDKFRSPHIWKKVNGEWKLRHTAILDGVDDK